MFDVEFDISELIQTMDRLESLSYEEFLKDTGNYIKKQIKSRLALGVDIEGDLFAPLNENYARRKEKAGYGNKPILTATGALGNSLFTELLADNELYASVTGTHAPIPGLTKKTEEMIAIAERHEFGLGIAQRQFLGINDLDADWIINRFGKLVEDTWK